MTVYGWIVLALILGGPAVLWTLLYRKDGGATHCCGCGQCVTAGECVMRQREKQKKEQAPS